MLLIQFADLEGMQAYYTNLGQERLTLDDSLTPVEALAIVRKIEKDRPTHSQPVCCA
jgi:hypothetical protein